MNWFEARPGLWVTDEGPQDPERLPALRESIDAIVRSSLTPVTLLFDATGPITPFSADVVQGYLRILASHRDAIRGVYVASDHAVVRFAGSVARLALRERLTFFSTVAEAVEHYDTWVSSFAPARSPR